MKSPGDQPSERPEGPVESYDWPKKLVGRVISPTEPPRVHGLDVWNDLARNYSFGETVLTTLRGEPPTEAEGAAFEQVMTFLLPLSVAEAPTHAAVLSRLCGALPGSSIAAGVVVLAEQVGALVQRYERLKTWLGAPLGGLPSEYLAGEAQPGTRALLEGLPDAIVGQLHPALRDAHVLTEALAVALLHLLGLRSATAVVGAFMCARLPALAAEVDRTKPGALRTYPMDMPPFRYREPNR